MKKINIRGIEQSTGSLLANHRTASETTKITCTFLIDSLYLCFQFDQSGISISQEAFLKKNSSYHAKVGHAGHAAVVVLRYISKKVRFMNDDIYE